MFDSLFGTKTLVLTAIAAVLFISGCSSSNEAAEPTPEQTQVSESQENSEKQEEQTTQAEPEFQKDSFSLDDPTSLWVIVNKQRPLNPIDFEPDNLVLPAGIDNPNSQPMREDAARAAEKLVAAAADAGLYLRIASGYRSYATQQSLYNSYSASSGSAAADRFSARPGHSEHQTGLAVDFDDASGCNLDACFGDTEAGKWLRENAADYGFILRYDQGTEDIVGYMYEPWHFRYVGLELAQEIKRLGYPTLEEFFGLDAAPNY